MTDAERDKIYDSYLEWKRLKVLPFLERRNQAFKKQIMARKLYLAADDALDRHEANKMFVDQLKRAFDKTSEQSNKAQKEYLNALDRFNLEAYLKEYKTNND